MQSLEVVNAAPLTQAARPRRRWARRLLAAAAATVVVLAVFHSTLLEWMAYGLVVNDPPAPTDVVVIVGSYGPFEPVPLDEAVEQVQSGAGKRVLLIEDRSFRLARLDITPTLESVVRRELAARDVPGDALIALNVTARGEGEGTRCLQRWLRENPEARVTILCNEFSSRRTAQLVRGILEPEEAGRVRWQAVPDRRFAATDWWRGRQGIVTVLGEYVALGLGALRDEEEVPVSWDPDQYEQSLRSPSTR